MKALFSAMLSAVMLARGAVAAVAGSAAPLPTPLWGTAANSVLLRGASSEIPPGALARAEECAGRAARFLSRLPLPGGPEGPEFWTAEKKRGLERDLVAFIPAPGIEDTAAAYAGRATIAYEWEGMADGPLAEAAFAEAYLESHPGTPLAPYLTLFLAHRYRCAFEILERGDDLRALDGASQGYRSALHLAQSADDPLIRFIADDMDARPCLYLPAGRPPAPETPPESTAAAPGTVLPLRPALDLADAHVRRARIDLAAQHLQSVTLRYDEAARASYWHLQWAWSMPRIGGEFGLRVYMDGRIVEARLGP